jgi:hypothetical protein
MTLHGPRRKRCSQQFFYYCECNVLIWPLHSNDSGIHVQTHRLMEGIHEVRRDMGLGVMIYIPSFIKTGSVFHGRMVIYTPIFIFSK